MSSPRLVLTRFLLVLFVLGGTTFAATRCAPPQGDEEGAKKESPAEPAASQPTASQDEPLLVPKHLLSAEEMGALAPLLETLLSDPKDRSAFEKLDGEIAKFETEKGWSPLGDPEAWRKAFEQHFYEGIKKDRVSGTGRPQEDVVLVEVKGELFAFEYSYIVPRGYDHEKRWPVLLCLHDEGSDGDSYLRKLWQAAKEDKELCEGFILVAPNIREKTLDKKYREGKSVERRIQWLDVNYLRSVLLPLNEIRKRFHCDPEKIFIEGVGTGADAALELAALAPGRFAGVIDRHGVLRDEKILPGLQGTNLLVVSRAEGPNYDKKAKQQPFFEVLKKAKEDGQIDFELAEAEKVDRLTAKQKADQDTDPVLEQNAAVADFIGRVKLDPYPARVRIVNGPNGFKSHPLVKITSHEVTEDNYLDFSLRFDRAKNRIEVTGKAFFKFTVFLNDQILDLDRPIEVSINGVTLENRTATRSTKQMVSDMVGQPVNYHQVLPGLLLVEVPDEQVKEEPKDGEKATGEAGGEKPADDKPADEGAKK